MPGPVFLEGDPVDLHTIETEDVDFLQRLVNDPRVRAGLKANAPVSRLEEREWVAADRDDGRVDLLACVDGDPVGSVTMKPPNDAWAVAEIGYFVDPDEWGNGYATAAVDLLASYAFRERGLAKLTATVFATNPASATVLERVGFVHEGTFRKEAFVDGERVDGERYGLLADEYLD